MKPAFVFVVAVLVSVTACNRAEPPKPAATEAAPPKPLVPSAVGIYVTNETSGDLSILDAETRAVVATVPLGKRPRGIAVSPDRATLYVALSGSPNAGPGVDESKLPPVNRSPSRRGTNITDSLRPPAGR